MKILTLNVRQGGGKRLDSIIRFIDGAAADVVVLTEYRENSNAPIFKTRFFESDCKWQASSSIVPNQNSVLLASKVPFVSNGQFDAADAHAHRLLFARFSQFNLIGVYFPQNEAKRPVFECLKGMRRDLLGESGLVIGDFNTGKLKIDEIGSTFSCADCFDALEGDGLVDSWRSRNQEAREFSWYSVAKNGFRIDHVFCTALLNRKVRHISYLHDSRPKLSDHSAMVVELDC